MKDFYAVFAVGGAVLVLIVAIVLGNSLFIVDQTNQAVVLQFGEPVRVIKEPGLKMIAPFIQSVSFYDKRVLGYEPPAEEVIAADKKRLVVDSVVRYKINDPLQFFKSVGTLDGANARLGNALQGALRRTIGTVKLAQLLSPERSRIMQEIRDDLAQQTKSFGIGVMDVRIRRADLPTENSAAIYERMKSERNREAKEFRAEGAEAAQGIRARADRERTVILADANRQAQIERGQGDAESIRIYAQSFGQDPNFFSFYRSLQAYRTALDNETTLILSPDDHFFRFLNGQKTDKDGSVGGSEKAAGRGQ